MTGSCWLPLPTQSGLLVSSIPGRLIAPFGAMGVAALSRDDRVAAARLSAGLFGG